MPLGCVLSPWVDEQKWRESLPKPPVFARLRNSKARLDLHLDISIGPSSAHKPRREVNYKAMPPSKGENCLLAAAGCGDSCWTHGRCMFGGQGVGRSTFHVAAHRETTAGALFRAQLDKMCAAALKGFPSMQPCYRY